MQDQPKGQVIVVSTESKCGRFGMLWTQCILVLGLLAKFCECQPVKTHWKLWPDFDTAGDAPDPLELNVMDVCYKMNAPRGFKQYLAVGGETMLVHLDNSDCRYTNNGSHKMEVERSSETTSQHPLNKDGHPMKILSANVYATKKGIITWTWKKPPAPNDTSTNGTSTVTSTKPPKKQKSSFAGAGRCFNINGTQIEKLSVIKGYTVATYQTDDCTGTERNITTGSIDSTAVLNKIQSVKIHCLKSIVFTADYAKSTGQAAVSTTPAPSLWESWGKWMLIAAIIVNVLIAGACYGWHKFKAGKKKKKKKGDNKTSERDEEVPAEAGAGTETPTPVTTPVATPLAPTSPNKAKTPMATPTGSYTSVTAGSEPAPVKTEEPVASPPPAAPLLLVHPTGAEDSGKGTGSGSGSSSSEGSKTANSGGRGASRKAAPSVSPQITI